MAAPVELVIKVLADVSKAKSGLDSVKSAGGIMGAGMQNAATGILVAGGAAAAFGLSAVKAAEESASVTAGLENVFKSMGDTTGTAAKEAQAYSAELMKQTGIDDELITTTQTKLATFAAVSDETARSAGIFDRATGAAADLAAAGFGSMDSNAVQLGKALNDPIKGIAALAKSGVTFTEAEKEQIAVMVEAGEVTKAQEMVLAAIEKQVGGTAEATATGSQKMSTAFGEAQESIGAALLPAFESLTETITEDLLPAIEPLIKMFADNIDIILPLAGLLLAVAAGLKIAALAQTLMNSAMWASPVTWIILGIVALIAVIVIIIIKWKDIVRVVKESWAAIVKALSAAWNWIKQTATSVFNGIKNLIAGVVDAIKGRWDAAIAFFLGIKDKVVGFFSSALNWLKDAGKRIVTGLWDGLKAAWTNVTTWLLGLPAKVLGFYVNAGKWLYNIGKDIIEGLWDGLKAMWSNVTGWLSGIGDKIQDLKGPPARDAQLLVGAGKLIMGGLQSGLESGWGGVESFLGSRDVSIAGGVAGGMAVGGARGGGAYNLNLYPRQVNSNDVAWGFRRLELARTGR